MLCVLFVKRGRFVRVSRYIHTVLTAVRHKCFLKEFDRYGMIDRLEYEEGADFAYIRFTDQNAAMDACRAMKGFPLGGRDRCIIVDFAK